MLESKLDAIIQIFQFFKRNSFSSHFFFFYSVIFHCLIYFSQIIPILNSIRVFLPMNPTLSLHKSQRIRMQGSIGFTFKWNSLTKSNLAWVFRSLTCHSKILRTDQLIKNNILMEITVVICLYDSSCIQFKRELQEVSNIKEKKDYCRGWEEGEARNYINKPFKTVKVLESHMHGSRYFSSTY